MAKRLFPSRPAAQKRFVRGMVARNPDWLTSASGDEILPEGVALNYPPAPRAWAPPASDGKNGDGSTVAEARPTPAKRTPPAKEPVSAPAAVPPPSRPPIAAENKTDGKPATNDRLVIAAVEPGPSDGLGGQATSEEIGRRLGDVKSKVGAMRAELDALRARYPSPPPAVQTLLIEMETRLLGVELSVARVALANAAPEMPAAPAPIPAPVAQEPAAKPAASPANETEKPPQAVAEVENKPPQAKALVVDAESSSTPKVFDAGLVLVAILGSGVGLSVVLYRRNQRVRGSGAEGENGDDLASESRSIGRAEAPSSGGQPAPASRETHEAAQPEAPLSDAPPESEMPPLVPAVSEAPLEMEHPAELAEILLVYGRTQGAVDVLSEYIERSPKDSLQPGLRLLEIYKQEERRREFELLAAQLARRFNIERPQWDDVLPVGDSIHGRTGTSHVPELFGQVPSHIKTHLTANWGTRECLDFLRSLLDDTRDGKRKGFPVSVTYAILGLIKAMEEELKRAK